MNAAVVAALISAAGLVLSVLCSAVVAAVSYGGLRADVRHLAEVSATHATKQDVANLTAQLAEVKGLFELQPRAVRRKVRR